MVQDYCCVVAYSWVLMIVKAEVLRFWKEVLTALYQQVCWVVYIVADLAVGVVEPPGVAESFAAKEMLPGVVE